MKIAGLIKTTLLDYPEHLAATIFLSGCNFLCPYCHNKDLVIVDENKLELFKEEDLWDFLYNRRNILEGVCITGGEPTIHPSLPDFIKKIKQMGYLIKLDTNGSNPNMINQLLIDDLIDYIAMDIKNSPNKYNLTINKPLINIDIINESIKIIKNSNIPYEFRTTIVKELHTSYDIEVIGKWLEGSKVIYLQNFKPSPNQIKEGFSEHTLKTLEEYKTILEEYIKTVEIRGIF